MADYRLFTEFRNQVKRFATLQKAYFTTFNLSPFFIETYILKAILDDDEVIPRSAKEFEDLQQKYFELPERERPDFRFLCDQGALETGEAKKTIFDIQLINPQKLGTGFRDGLFHPKVIWLEGLDPKGNHLAIIGSGSANLTISGWGRNAECFRFQTVDDRANYLSAAAFFSALGAPLGAAQEYPNRRAPWRFIHSFNTPQMLPALLEGGTQDLTIWSPYFGSEVDAIITKAINPNLKGRLAIVPDISAPSGKIRMATDDESRMREQALFVRDNSLLTENGDLRFVHAKIWLSDSRIAVGSWNFTSSALGLTENANNIEAGFIFEINQAESKSFLKDLVPFAPQFMTRGELNEDEEIPVPGWRGSVVVMLDWQDFKYQLEIEIEDDAEVAIRLPWLRAIQSISAVPKEGVLSVEEQQRALRSRYFTVHRGENILFTGVLREKNPQARPSWGFDKFEDLMRAWLDPRGPERRIDKLVAANVVDDLGKTTEDSELELASQVVAVSWFVMFTALANMSEQLSEIKISAKPEKLLYFCFRQPGCLKQLYAWGSKMTQDSSNYSRVFKWYLVQEINKLIREASKLAKSLKVPFALQALAVPKIENLNETDKQYLEEITRTLKYA
jgi:hypothetical protein